MQSFNEHNLDDLNATDLRPAGVLIPVFLKNGELNVIFTKRSNNVQHHKGQICFPGGSRETHDENLWQTATRETEEELGIDRNTIYHVGKLPSLITPTRFRITPYIGFITSEFDLKPCPVEVDSVFAAPLTHFLDHINLRFEKRVYAGKEFDVPFFRYKSHEIWGATGSILLTMVQQFSSDDVLKAKHLRMR